MEKEGEIAVASTGRIELTDVLHEAARNVMEKEGNIAVAPTGRIELTDVLHEAARNVMEKEGNIAVAPTGRIELADVLHEAARNVLLWILIAVSSLRLILSWLLESFAAHSPGLWCYLSAGFVLCVKRAFKVIVLVVRTVVTHAPLLVLAVGSKLQGMALAAFNSCLICGQLLHKDELCDKVVQVGRYSVTWARQNCLSVGGCRELCSRISRASHRVWLPIFVRSHAHCPRLVSTLSSCVTLVRHSAVVRYLIYALSLIVGVSVACLHRGWLLVIGACMAVADHLVRQFHRARTRVCPGESSDTARDRTCGFRMMWSQVAVSVTGDIWERLQCQTLMTSWRISHTRCSPRLAFYGILGFVTITFVVTTYLYMGGAVGVSDPDQHGKHHWQPKHNEELRESLVRHVDPLIYQKSEHKDHQKRKDHVGEEEDWPHPSTPRLSKVMDVISLMAGHRSPNETSTPGIQKQELRRQIKLLREAMISEQTMLPKLPEPPACVGNRKPEEVEDILCIPRPKYLTHVKNPCWYSDIPSDQGGKTLHCLPYFHILGCAKSGTTDLWNRLMSHPHTVFNDGLLHKEALWWSWYRYGIVGYSKRREIQNFSDYVDLFQDTARQIKASIDKETLFHQTLITGDASPPDFWDFRGWTNISQNRQFNVPVVITPHLMRHIYANPKFIIMFRDPIDRLYSDYFFVGLGLTAQDFHNDILISVDMLARCVEQHGLQHCFHNHDLYVKLPVRLPFACYSVFMREWLRVFPLESFHFIKTEEYEKNPEETLKSVMEFLGLGPLKDSQLQVIAEEERARITVQKHIAGPMKNATKHLLEELLGACSTELARLIKSDKFTWGT